MQFLLLTALALFSGQAGGIYQEVGGGASYFIGSDPIFGNKASGTMGPGTLIYLSPGMNFSNLNAAVQFHLALRGQISFLTAKGTSYGIVVGSPMMRLELKRKAYIGLGATPLVLTRQAASAGFDTYKLLSGGIAAIGELGFQWMVTPKFFINFGGTAQIIKSGGGLGPAPTIEVAVSLRWYFALTGSNASLTRDRWEGWRYPFYF